MTAQEYYDSGDYSEVDGAEDSIPPSNLVDMTETTIVSVIQAYLDGTLEPEIKATILQDGKSLSLEQINQIIAIVQPMEDVTLTE